VVVTDVGTIGESVREDRTGVVVSSSDPVEMAEAITSLLNDAPRRADAASRMRRATHSKYSWEQVGRATHELHNRLTE